MQRVEWDGAGVVRFRQNRIVRDLLDFASARGFDLNEIARRDYTAADCNQLAQLIGYSVAGFGDLSYADPEIVAAADRAAAALPRAGKGRVW